MGETTRISWCDHTFNPWIGCQKVSAACDNCYAETWDNRFGGGHWGPGAPRRRTSPQNWNQVRRWNRQAISDGVRRTVFVASLADIFDKAAEPEWLVDVWRLIQDCPGLDFLLLTKRPQNIPKRLPPDWGDGWPNVWLGTSVENQEEADRRIPHMLAVPAVIHFLSCEPLLGPVDLTRLKPALFAADASALTGLWKWRDGPSKRETTHIDWVICGGESGTGARPMHPDWARSLRDQCAAAGVPFFFKQWGEWAPQAVANSEKAAETAERIDLNGHRRAARFGARRPGEVTVQRSGKRATGDRLDGRQHQAWPQSRAAA